MAANYWASSQRLHWTFTKPGLAETRRQMEENEKALHKQYPLPEQRLISIFLMHQVNKLAKRMNYKQQIIATAQVYIRRFYTKVEIRRTNPFLVVTTAFYLACKTEESPQHIRVILAEGRNNWGAEIIPDQSKMGECEFTLISELNSQLIVHHPYRTLYELQQTFSLPNDEFSTAWHIINDHYLTDLPLLYPPHVIAVTAVFLAVVIRPAQNALLPHQHQHHAGNLAGALQSLTSPQSAAAIATQAGVHGPTAGAGASGSAGAAAQGRIVKVVNWLAESRIDMEAVVDATQELISLYEVWDQFNEKACKDAVLRFVQARGLDK
ncbi:RNA polymerase II holoenzyme cyclin-like subunit [Lineolata rhizophorae]|uniref:RNA polymerase II holoenzyme cyclin-like subunit n=1 Tax=Lineolata rhizophorae TaxID=578093 RepID=A0A6A6P0B6_9PEZI|nr:RNA polymerase II holoenzyme cyclin-like subunit [Lineolata rhizophorae]